MKHTFTCLVFLLLLLGTLQATVRNVPLDFATIQAAITASANGDMVLVAPGTYTENINFQGKAIVVSSNYINNNTPQTISTTIIHGTGTGSVVTFSTNEDSTSVLCGFSITGGNYNLGGGISIRNASPCLKTWLCMAIQELTGQESTFRILIPVYNASLYVTIPETV